MQREFTDDEWRARVLAARLKFVEFAAVCKKQKAEADVSTNVEAKPSDSLIVKLAEAAAARSAAAKSAGGPR